MTYTSVGLEELCNSKVSILVLKVISAPTEGFVNQVEGQDNNIKLDQTENNEGCKIRVFGTVKKFSSVDDFQGIATLSHPLGLFPKAKMNCKRSRAT